MTRNSTLPYILKSETPAPLYGAGVFRVCGVWGPASGCCRRLLVSRSARCNGIHCFLLPSLTKQLNLGLKVKAILDLA